jgi:hypothetical protein
VKIFDNEGKCIGRLDVAVTSKEVITVSELRNVTTITVRDRATGRVDTNTLFGEPPLGSVQDD